MMGPRAAGWHKGLVVQYYPDMGRYLLPVLAALTACTGGVAEQVRQDTDFATLVSHLSEPGGYFDTDNLISNETSYLHVMGGLRELDITGGAYIGVGPDQNFSYIAQIRPSVAFVVDIRRDNMLQHLMFKAMFALTRNRAEYLSLLFGRPPPDDTGAWSGADITEIVEYLDALDAAEATVAAARSRVDSTIRTFGVPLSASDWRTIDRFHRTFVGAGLSLKFSSVGRSPRFYYPTYRDLVLERDRSGTRSSYLVAEEDFQYVKRLQERDGVIPVVGDLAGDHAIRAIGRLLEEQGIQVLAFYTSNVEFYLFRAGTFGHFVGNVEALPRTMQSVLIRSVFHSTFGRHPLAVEGYFSTQLLQTMSSLIGEHADGGYGTYRDLALRHVLR